MTDDRKTSAFQIVGKNAALVDAWKKVTGEGLYTDDFRIAGLLIGKIVRSTRAHARIVKVDTSRALAMEGVRAVVTGLDPGAGVKFGVLPISKDETALAVDRVKYVGDCVAAVAADDEEIAIAAAESIVVEYEDLEPCLDPRRALQPQAVPLLAKSPDGTNLHKAVDQAFGDVDAALQASAAVSGGRYEFAPVTHGFTEPHCVIAHFEPDGRLVVISAQQVPHYLHRAMAEVMQMPMHRIRIVRPMVGGGFGGKSDPFPHEMVAALLARRAGRPVKINFDREDVFLTNHGRHPTQYDIRIGMASDGAITGLDAKALIDGGAWGSFGVVTTYYNGVLSQGPYKIPNFRYSGRRVYTNKPPSGAMRGHGSVNARFAIESELDRLCEQLGLDPFDVRRKNALSPNSTTVNQFRITSTGLVECLERTRAASQWDRKFRRMPYGRGIGLGCGFYISGSALPIHFDFHPDPKYGQIPQSTVHVKIDLDAGVTVHSLAADTGQGSDTMLAQCVAEPLGIPLSRVRVRTEDTDLAPIDLGSYSSRVTFMAGNAARNAALAALEKLQIAAARLTGRPAQSFIARDEKLVDVTDPAVAVSFDAAVREAMRGTGALQATGSYQSPRLGGNFKGANAGLSPSYSFQAFVAEVEVDPDTGAVRVTDVWAAHDCGRALNPVVVQGQIEGSVHMGLGQALSEDMRYLKGQVLNANLLDYKVLTSVDTPRIHSIVVESIDPEGPFGAKECGEGALAPVIPAVANAIYDAVGVRLTSVPMTAEKILAGMRKAGRGAKPKLPAGAAR